VCLCGLSTGGWAGLVAGVVGCYTPDRVTLVGVDGVDGSGKTTFADELARRLREQGHQVERVRLDDYLAPRAVRHARGRHSPEGFYLDSYDLEAFRREVLTPLRTDGWYRPVWFSLADDAPVDEPRRYAAPGTLVIVDGMFLHRAELRDAWDHSVFLDVPFAETFRRMAIRDGCPADPDDPRNARYVEGQRLYLRTDEPTRRASAVVDNTDPTQPVLIRG